MTLLPLVFLLNGLSVPVPEIDPADLSDTLQQAQQIAVSNPEQCIQLTESVQLLQENPLLPGRSTRSNSSGRLRDRVLLRNSRQQIQALIINGSCYALQERYTEALAALDNAEQIANRQHFDDLAGISLYRQIIILGLDLNKPIPAHHAWRRLNVLLQNNDLTNSELPVYVGLLNSALAIHRQLPELAREMLSQVRTLLVTRPDPQLAIWAEMLEGDLLHITNQDEHSLLSYHETLEQAQKNNQLLLQLQLTTRISQLFAQKQDLANAIIYAEQALELTQQFANESWQADAIIHLAQLKREARDTNLALALLLNASGVYKHSTRPQDLARLHLEIGKTYQQLHRYNEAQTYLTAAYELFQRERLPYYERLSLLSLAELYTQQDNPTQAIVLLEQMLNTPIPEQKNLETEMYRLLSIAYENNQQFDQALLNYKLFTNSQHESATTEEPPQSDFFANYTRLDQSQRLQELDNEKRRLDRELSWYFKVGISAALLMTILGIALLWHIRKIRRLRQEQQLLRQLIDYDAVTNMGTSLLLQKELGKQQTSIWQPDGTASGHPATTMLLFRASGLTDLECRVGLKKAQSILRQVSHAIRQRMPEQCRYYLLSDRLLLCTLPEDTAAQYNEIIVRIENRLGVIMRKYGLNERVICGKVQYPFLSKSVNALKPVQTLEVCGIALAGAMQLSEKLGKNVWVELFAIDYQQAAFFNGELRTKTIEAITKGLVKVNSSEMQVSIDWNALLLPAQGKTETR
ncbi:MAG: tetratricopeptide repeat protein [Tolumonas sp.]|jgi:tetratricopeptide (TPR) repeat protein|nr:tetratricopeptide repeat protein [Tolumonas sp.]